MAAQDTQSTRSEDGVQILRMGLEHSWQWFLLHANQRMQGVNFFLLASAFLTTAYVTAIHNDSEAVALGVALMGVAFSACFFLFEIRVRELLKAGEHALKPAQSQLANLIGIADFRICDIVEVPKFRWTSYHKIIRLLYGATFACFTAAAIYATDGLHSFWDGLLSIVLYRTLLVFAGIGATFWGQRLIDRESNPPDWVRRTAGLALIIGGILVLSASVFKSIR